MMGVECENTNLLAALVAGALPEAERAAVANHVASCERCHALIECLVETGAGEPVMAVLRTSEFSGTDRFAVVRRIGAGGMGVVYEVWDREREAPSALKTLRALSPRRLSLFKHEFRALRGVSHRNLVTLGELVQDGGHWFFTMELVDGEPFLSWVHPGHPEAGARFDEANEERLREGLRQLAGALCALHRSGKVHCDIKPSNVLVTRARRVVVLDFGLVRDVRDPADCSDHVMGTPAYMAPEQARGGELGPAADWYAVGVMLYEALTGRLPFAGTVVEVLAVKMMRLPLRPALLVADLPEDLDALCMRLLAIDPAQRAGADDVLRVLGGDAGTAAMF